MAGLPHPIDKREFEWVQSGDTWKAELSGRIYTIVKNAEGYFEAYLAEQSDVKPRDLGLSTSLKVAQHRCLGEEERARHEAPLRPA